MIFGLPDALARLGLELEEFGPGAVLVRALPAALGTIEAAPLVRDLGVAVEGKKEYVGKKLKELPAEEGLYWGVMKYWFPQLQLVEAKAETAGITGDEAGETATTQRSRTSRRGRGRRGAAQAAPAAR